MVFTVLTLNRDILPILQELANNTNPQPYTIENLWWTKLNVVISIIAAFMGGIGAWYGYKGFVQSRKTAQNVVRMSIDTQMSLCVSLLMDLVRNYVYGFVVCLNHKSGKCPSENYILALTLPDFGDIIYPESFNQRASTYLALSYIKQRMNRYNNTLSLVKEHSSGGCLTDRDCEDLLEKPLKVIKSVLKFAEAAYPGKQTDLRLQISYKLLRDLAGYSSQGRCPIAQDDYAKKKKAIREICRERNASPLTPSTIILGTSEEKRIPTGRNPFRSDEVYSILKEFYEEESLRIFQKEEIEDNDMEKFKEGINMLLEYNIICQSQYFG